MLGNGAATGAAHTAGVSAHAQAAAEAAPVIPKLAPAARGMSLSGRLRALVASALPSAVLVRHGERGARRVALTFDDGPDEMTDAYLDVLRRHHARATFFVVGRNCVARRRELLRIVADGHEVAGHGFTHDVFTKMDGPALRA